MGSFTRPVSRVVCVPVSMRPGIPGRPGSAGFSTDDGPPVKASGAAAKAIAVGAAKALGSAKAADRSAGPLLASSRSFVPIHENLSATKSYFRPRVPPRISPQPIT